VLVSTRIISVLSLLRSAYTCIFEILDFIFIYIYIYIYIKSSVLFLYVFIQLSLSASSSEAFSASAGFSYRGWETAGKRASRPERWSLFHVSFIFRFSQIRSARTLTPRARHVGTRLKRGGSGNCEFLRSSDERRRNCVPAGCARH